MRGSQDVRVLIAEDDYLVSEMIRELLEDAGYTVVGKAVSGLQAVEMAQSTRPDVILMDIKMPGVDGIEATRRIYECCPTPVVALTAYETPELVAEASAAGVGAYLIKPPNAREIERTITVAMARFDDMMELRRLNAELERFTYAVSHDLKSPLITINGFLELLEQDMATGNTEQMRASLAYISNAAAQMGQLLDELLQFSRIGRLDSPLEDVPLGELAREVVGVVAGRLAQRGVQVDIAPDLPAVHGNRPRLFEVLQNLIDNAAKFMGDQQEPRIEIGARRDGEETVFYVRDNGIGIEPQHHAHVFGVFAQLSPKAEGTGMGLAIVKRIVEMQGGHVWVESEGAGHGSTFCFTLAPQ